MTERRAVYAERNGVAVADPTWLGAKDPRELIDMIGERDELIAALEERIENQSRRLEQVGAELRYYQTKELEERHG